MPKIAPAENDYDWLANVLKRRPTQSQKMSMCEFAESTVIPIGQYRGAKFEMNRAPYMREPLEMLGPESPMQEVVLMWSAQSSKTTVGETFVSYHMKVVPSEILVIAANDDQAKKIMEKRIAKRAQVMGIQFRSQVDDATARRSGNTTISKEFDGGNIDAASARSPAQLSSETKRIIMCDEVDRWPVLSGREGYTLDLVRARSQAWGMRKKILLLSTPTTYDESVIWVLYQKGDRRLYFVPCPSCGEMQTLKMFDEDSGGLTWTNVAGDRIKEDSIGYVCCGCGTFIEENKKHYMLNGGEWRSTAQPEHSGRASYHINALYSPFKQWLEIAREFNTAQSDPIHMHTFTNLVLGMPYRDIGSRISHEKAIEHRGEYKAKEPPNDVLWITSGADVQSGKQIYEPMTDEQILKVKDELVAEGGNAWTAELPRIEMEVLGHGYGFKTWSIEYLVFYGKVDDVNSGAWSRLAAWIEETKLEYMRPDGSKIWINNMFIDSGAHTDTVYSFCDLYPFITPSKGDQELKRRKAETGDERKRFDPYRVTRMNGHQELVTMSTNYYKSKIYNYLKIPRVAGDNQPNGFPDHPASYADYYFKMLTSEERRADGSFHAGRRRNEALDCKVMAMCASDRWMDMGVDKVRALAISRGATREEAAAAYGKAELLNELLNARAQEMAGLRNG